MLLPSFRVEHLEGRQRRRQLETDNDIREPVCRRR